MEEKNPRTNLLEARRSHCVCKYCGGPLRIKSLVFNDYVEGRTELYCDHCGRIEGGVEKEIYESARYYVEAFDFNYYPGLDVTETTRQMSVARVAEMMEWFAQSLGLVNDHGFTVPVHLDAWRTSGCLHLTDDDLARGE